MFDKNHVKVGAVPNAWSNDDLPALGGSTPYEQCLDEMALAGYEGTEMGSKYPTDPEVLNEALALRGLRMSGAWFSLFFTMNGARKQTLENFRRMIPFYRAVGIQHVYVAEVGRSSHLQPIPALANKPVFDDRQWDSLATGLEELGRLANDNGLRIVYHHHTGTGVQTQEDVQRLMTSTDPKLVWLLLDTAHITVGGGNALALAEQFADRICHVHLKNVRANVLEQMRQQGLSFWDGLRAGIFTVPGDTEGMLDLDAVLKVLGDRGFKGWMVVEAEQDPAKANPLKYFKMARAYLAEKAGL
jgi:inosose dehydratase